MRVRPRKLQTNFRAWLFSLLWHVFFLLTMLEAISFGKKEREAEVVTIQVRENNPRTETLNSISHIKKTSFPRRGTIFKEDTSVSEENLKGQQAEMKWSYQKSEEAFSTNLGPISQNKDQVAPQGSSSEGHQETKGHSAKADLKELPKSQGAFQRIGALSESPPQEETFVGEKFAGESLNFISRIVREKLQYPFIARRMGWEGEVVLFFKLSPQGEVLDLKILKSSGYEVLDREALEAINRAKEQFPRPKIMVALKLPVLFKLSK